MNSDLESILATYNYFYQRIDAAFNDRAGACALLTLAVVLKEQKV